MRHLRPSWSEIAPLDYCQFGIDFLVHDVARLRRTVIDKALRRIGVTGSQWWVLVTLEWYNLEPVTQAKLAQAMEISRATLGGLITRLEAAGLVRRQRVSTDRRANAVVVTARGVKLLDEMQSVGLSVTAEITKGIPAEEIEKSEMVLHQMKRRLIGMNAIRGAGFHVPGGVIVAGANARPEP